MMKRLIPCLALTTLLTQSSYGERRGAPLGRQLVQEKPVAEETQRNDPAGKAAGRNTNGAPTGAPGNEAAANGLKDGDIEGGKRSEPPVDPLRGGEEVQVRIYFIGDLMQDAPNHKFEGIRVNPIKAETPWSLGGMPGTAGIGGGGANPAANAGAGGRSSLSSIDIDQLVETIRGPGGAEEWRERGRWQVARQGQSLLVSAPDRVQRVVETLLKDLRQLGGVVAPVTVHASWVVAKPADYTELKRREKHSHTSGATGDVESFRESLRSRSLFTGQITCLDGQTVHMLAGEIAETIKEATPVISNERALYDARLGLNHLGAMLQITPISMTASNQVRLDLESIVILPIAKPAAPTIPAGAPVSPRPVVQDAAQDAAARIIASLIENRQHAHTARFATTVNLMRGMPRIVAAQTIQVPSAISAEGTPTEGSILALIAEVEE